MGGKSATKPKGFAVRRDVASAAGKIGGKKSKPRKHEKHLE